MQVVAQCLGKTANFNLVAELVPLGGTSRAGLSTIGSYVLGEPDIDPLNSPMCSCIH